MKTTTHAAFRLNGFSDASFKHSDDSCPGRKRMDSMAFSRLELVMIIASLLLVLAAALPALASKARSQQIACFNNLRQIGRAFHLWGNDHRDMLPFYVPVEEGGSAVPSGTITTTWYQFGVLSNELGTAKVLACPSDNKLVATDFSMSPSRGLFHNNFRNNAVSYFIGHPYWRDPGNILCGDRNLRFNTTGSTCAFLGISVAVLYPYSSTGGWTNNIHLGMGHFLFVDGAVSLWDNEELAAKLPTIPSSSNFHFLTP